MLGYQIKIAIKSLRRNPVLSAVLVTGIALGIAVSTAFVTIRYVFSGDPIPHKSDRLFYVQLDSWGVDRPYDDDYPEEPPAQLTYMDARAVMESDIPTLHSAMYKASLTVHPETEAERPFRASTRLCFRDFFPMFDVPFTYGTGWDDSADLGAETVVVLGHETNQTLFGGRDSVGEAVRIEDRTFTVVGVLAPWQPRPKFYDTRNFSYGDTEELYIPFNLVEPMEIGTSGNTNGWKFQPGNEFADRLTSENAWIQMWAQLDSEAQRDEYQAFLDAYTTGQRKVGRFERPLNNRVRPVMEWMEADRVVPEQSMSLMIISLLFLVVCSVNLIGILLGKFLSRAPEVGVRRALGASKMSVFVQHIVECEVIGVIGGALGLVLSIGALAIINRLMGDGGITFQLDLAMVGAGMILALGAGLIAGLYPSWRICSVPPATYLKLQ